ncbi:sugar transporter [Suillus spraguei]|nr:sugar transporter [Suillus spraguei]
MAPDPSDNVSISPSKEHIECEELDLNVEFGGVEARKKLERRLLRKLDLHMLMLVLIYILNFIDRNNVGRLSAARSRGLVTDLHLKGQQFATVLSILYVGYIIMQVPSNMFLNYIGKPSIYLPVSLTGITTNFVGALLMRFFLGFVEAAFFPGAVFLISKWFVQERRDWCQSGHLLLQRLRALIASGILANMDGVRAQAAWRWLFYIEGSLTITVAIIAIFVLPDFPATTKWITDDERRLALKRMKEDAGVGDEVETESGGFGYGFRLAITDWKVWWLATLSFAQVVALSFVVYFPSLTATLGYNPTVSLLLVAPPWIYAVIFTFLWARHSDKTQERFFHLSISNLIGVIGSLISICTMNTAARYLSLFFMAQSCSAHVLMTTWISSTFPRPPSKRAVCFSLINAVQQLGNVAGSYVWPLNWGPGYRYSYAIVIAGYVTATTMTWILRQHLKTLNKKLEKGEEEQGIKVKGFRYVL